MQTANHRWDTVSSKFSRYRDTLLAAAIRYSLSRWEQLSRFLTDGHIDLDNNPVERAIRPVALGRKRPSSRR